MTKLKMMLIALPAVLLAACAPPPSDEDVVAERAQARWDALVDSDFEASYEYHSPGYREETTVTGHIVGLSRRKITWVGAEIVGVNCDEARCEVETSVTYSADGAPGVLAGMKNTRTVREIWVRLDDQWWYSEGT